MGCLVGKIERIGGGLKGCIARTGNALSCGITLACEIRPAIVRRIGAAWLAAFPVSEG